MKLMLTIFVMSISINALAVDGFDFSCKLKSQTLTSMEGIKKAPDSNVVEVKVKMLKDLVQLYTINVTSEVDEESSDKRMIATDWVAKDTLSKYGNDLLGLLSFFFGFQTNKVVEIRAAMMSDLLEDLNYLELKDSDGKVTKLAFVGITPTECE